MNDFEQAIKENRERAARIAEMSEALLAHERERKRKNQVKTRVVFWCAVACLCLIAAAFALAMVEAY